MFINHFNGFSLNSKSLTSTMDEFVSFIGLSFALKNVIKNLRKTG